MNICYVCGDKGRIKDLIYCGQCKFQVSVVHRYCKWAQADETAGWTCDDCLDEKMTQYREASRKSSRVQERWIKKSNYKAIHKPTKAEMRGIVLDSSHSEVQMGIQSTKGSLRDTCDHLQPSEQRKDCFKCDIKGNITDLIDCVQCHIFFVHSQCKSWQENDSPDWTCDYCMNKKEMQLIQPPRGLEKTSRMRAGWIPKNQHSNKRLKMGFHDNMFRKESGVRLSKKSDHGRASSKWIKVQTPNLKACNSIHVENRHRRKLIMDYSDIFDDENQNVDTAAEKATQELLQNAQDWQRQVEPGNDTSSDKNGGETELQPLELMDQSIKGARHDAIAIKDDPAKMPLDNVPAEPIMNPVWRGDVLIRFGRYRADMELLGYLSTKSSSEVAETLKALPSTVGFYVKCRSVVWPRRFHISTLTDSAIDVYFFPKYEKDEAVYYEISDYEMKHELALMYEMPSKNQNLLIFSSRLLPAESRRLRNKYYMWGALEEKGRCPLI